MMAVYLDYAANTPTSPEVLEAFVAAARYIGNPNSTHSLGREAGQEMDRVTKVLAEMMGVLPEEIIYTSGATESTNLAIKGVAHTSRHVGKHIISTALEHSSVGASLTVLQNQGYEIDLLDVGRDGKIDLDQLQSLLRKDTVLVALGAIDSELGVCQPVEKAAKIIRDFPDCRFYLDATQAVGKIPVDFSLADLTCIAPHKFYGLNGCGLLLKRKGIPLEPQISGGTSTTLYRSGTPALALAASIEPALRAALENMAERNSRVTALNQHIRDVLGTYERVRINSPSDAVPHILNVSVKNVKGSVFQKTLDSHGICVSLKSACSVENMPSKSVYAVSRDRRNALSSWRISLSHLTTDEEIAQFLSAFDQCYKELVQ